MSTTENKDIAFMREALELAKASYAEGEVPVGAVVVRNGEVVGRGRNARETSHLATAHAELLAIEDACRALGTWRLSDCTLYVTMEPCPMCAGAIVNSRMGTVVWGCSDAVAGCMGSVMNFRSYPFSHAFDVRTGVLSKESSRLLGDFFAEKRRAKRQ